MARLDRLGGGVLLALDTAASRDLMTIIGRLYGVNQHDVIFELGWLLLENAAC